MNRQELLQLLKSEKLAAAIGRAVIDQVMRAVIHTEEHSASAARHPAVARPNDDEPTIDATSSIEDRHAWLLQQFNRRWVCIVVRSGFHNGARCSPDDPHGSEWGCAWFWEASLTDAQKNLVSGATSTDA